MRLFFGGSTSGAGAGAVSGAGALCGVGTAGESSIGTGEPMPATAAARYHAILLALLLAWRWWRATKPKIVPLSAVRHSFE